MEWIQVEGMSMHPLIAPHDRVAVQWLNIQDLPQIKSGDLILGRTDLKDWTVHRVLRRSKEVPGSWIIKGDSSLAWEVLSDQQIWGKVIALQKTSSKKRLKIQTDFVDASIALFSYWSIPPEHLKSKIARLILRSLLQFRQLYLKMHPLFLRQ